MNRILVLVVIILVPFAVFTSHNDATPTIYGVTLENKSLEINLDNTPSNSEIKPQVLVSLNQDKSDAFTLDLEEYIIGVVAGEMPASFAMEALKAQAVASRTYAMYKMQNIASYVLSTTTSDQVYLTTNQMQQKWGNDYDFYYNRIKEAVEATSGEVLTYNDNIAITYYFAISNGYTDDASYVFNEDKDYLVSVDSSWDKNYSSYRSNFTMNKTNFCNRLNISCDNITISNITRADNHYVRTITINDKTFTGTEIFSKLNLKSHDFELQVTDNGINITTYGFGHGVGMSQYGAQGMATNGYTYEEILSHYYQNTNLSKL